MNDAPEVPPIDPALGTVVDQGRGSLPFALVHGESLIACAAWGLGDSGVTPVDFSTLWEGLADSGETFVLHDALCPLLPAWFIASCVVQSQTTGAVVVGVRPVTDTVKSVVDGVVGATVDRAGLVTVASPVVLPPAVVAALPALPSYDFAELVHALRDSFEVQLVEAPPEGRSVSSEADVRLLEALTGSL